jgi:hypothetical protein
MIDLWTYLRNFKWGWVDAVKEAETTGDLTALARVLRSDSPIEPSTRDLLANLCDQRRLGRKQGRPLKPLFGSSEQSAWIDALREAEKSGDLTSLACLLRSNTPMEQSTRELMAKLFDRRRLVRKRGGQPTPIFKMSAQDRLLDAARAVRQLRQVNKVWEDARVRHPEFFKRVEDELGDPEFFKRVRDPKARDEVGDPEEYIRRVKDLLGGDPRKFVRNISDPVGYVAKQLGLDEKMLENVLQGKMGFGRKAKPKPKAGSADK